MSNLRPNYGHKNKEEKDGIIIIMKNKFKGRGYELFAFTLEDIYMTYMLTRCDITSCPRTLSFLGVAIDMTKMTCDANRHGPCFKVCRRNTLCKLSRYDCNI